MTLATLAPTTSTPPTTPAALTQPAGMPDQVTLLPHQIQAHDFATTRPYSGIWLSVGGMKTLSTLAALQTIRPVGHILLVAPIAIARSTWIDEVEKWNFNIRCKSLIVDENDHKLSKTKRLQRFAEIFTDPPTMYFINRELLTQQSNPEHLLTTGPTQEPVPTDFAQLATGLLQLVTESAAMTRDELVESFRTRSTSARPPTKKDTLAAIKALLATGHLIRETAPCRGCNGDGCSRCAFGLVNQMPTQIVDGREEITWPFRTVIVDESQGFASHTSQRFKALAKVRPNIDNLIELTGTPTPGGLHDLWSQIYLLDQGEALGKNITAFRERWFTPKMVPGTTTPASWEPVPGAEQEIYAAISHLVMSVENTSIVLPEKTVEDVHVVLPPELLIAYRDFRRELVYDVVSANLLAAATSAFDGWLSKGSREAQLVRTELAGLTGDAHDQAYDRHVQGYSAANHYALVTTVVADNQAILTSKLMQFASGTLYTSDPDDPSTKGRYEVIHDKKLAMLEYLVRNAGSEPVLIAYHFRSDLKQILARFAATGVDAQLFDGSREMKHRWNARQIPVMLLHPASAGHGINIQNGGSTLIWYTLPFSLEHYMQTNGRLHRPGQTDPVTIYRLITTKTQDERMPGVLALKDRRQTRLIQAVSADPVLAALTDELHDDIQGLTKP